jgi:hypothetical protein
MSRYQWDEDEQKQRHGLHELQVDNRRYSLGSREMI